MTSLIGHWLHAVFLPTWWADLLDWRCFWPPSEFTACWLIWSANDRARSVFAWPWGRARRRPEAVLAKGYSAGGPRNCGRHGRFCIHCVVDGQFALRRAPA